MIFYITKKTEALDIITMFDMNIDARVTITCHYFNQTDDMQFLFSWKCLFQQQRLRHYWSYLHLSKTHGSSEHMHCPELEHVHYWWYLTCHAIPNQYWSFPM